MTIFDRSIAVFTALWLAACAVDAGSAEGSRQYANPQRVTIEGYRGDAMEPFLSRDGRYLLFNNLNHPSVNTNLHFAERIDDTTFRYRGELQGVNTPALEGVATMDRNGLLYFVSLRSYEATLSTIYRGKFSDGVVSDVQLVSGLSLKQTRMLNFDVDVAPDGDTLYFVDGRFGFLGPKTADIVIAKRTGDGFVREPESAVTLAAINTPALEYAPCISADGRLLLFTRMRAGFGAKASIFMARRARIDTPFGPPQRLIALDGHVEGPALSADQRHLYYHKQMGDRFVIFMASRL